MSRSELPRPAPHRGESDGRLWLAIGMSLTGLSFAHGTLAAGILPQGGAYVAGTGAIASQGNGLVITQPGSTRGVVDWNSFSVGKSNSVTFDNGSGATLNRVTGGSPSAILGRLSATGSLYVLNPQGIVVGSSGVVTTGGRFVASTLDACNDAFMQGSGSLTLSGNSNAAVINLGRISSSGGDVFLIARDAVINDGTVSAPNGTAELAAGGQVLLKDSGSSKQVFVQTGSQGTVVNKGRITAAQISLQAADGNVYALAGGGTRVRATGTASRDGHVWLVADGGRVEQDGSIAASNADGSGGTVDTQAAQLAFSRHAAVHAGQWNLSTPAFTIDEGAAHTLQRSLNAGTSVDVTTTGANGATGDLGVASGLLWSGPASLTLAAYHGVLVATGTTIANTGAGNLTLRADASGIDNGGSVTNVGTLDWSKSTGAISAFYDANGTYSAGTQLFNTTWTPGPYSGLLTQSTAYKLVNLLDDLKNVAADLAGNYALGKDINASATSDGSYAPLGNSVTPFIGQFDGQGHTVSSLTLQPWVPADPYAPPLVGMFGAVGSMGVVRNLTVQGNGVAGPGPFGVPAYGNMGMLAGTNSGTIIHVNAAGNLSTNAGSSGVDYTSAGGLVGVNAGTILRSASSVSLTAGGSLGGLAGANSGLIAQSFSSGPLNSLSYINHGAGGLVDYNSGTIEQSYSTSTTLLQGYCRGSAGNPCGGAGLVVTNDGTISQSFATGRVTQPFYQPIGIARTNNGTIAGDVYWDKESTTATVGVVYGTPVPASNGLTTAQMSTPGSFASFDFGPTGVWAMPVGATHPVLRWQLAH
ncbi:filamentous hemagglutinin N-terminal domain-containing protein [Burkholderia sp. M6-3]